MIERTERNGQAPTARRRTVAVGLALAAAVGLGRPTAGRACDICAIYNGTQLGEGRTGPSVGLAEQFTSYDTLQRDGEEVRNAAGEWMNSYITQVLVAYRVLPRLSLQLTLPVIARTYRRQEQSGVVHGDETGAGDLSLLASGRVVDRVDDEFVSRLSLLGGVKLPTGDAGRLREESAGQAAAASRGAAVGGGAHGGEQLESGVHGHDLALGSGSTDAVLGAEGFASWRRIFVSGSVQYVIRTSGKYGYHYADDLTWNAGPGAFVRLADPYSVAVQAAISGETKGKDSQDGSSLDDTARTGAYVGPAVRFTWADALGAEAAVDVPFVQNNTSLQVVPDYRLRFAATWAF